MSTLNELLDISAVGQAALLARGEISASELTGLYLTRIARHNPELWAYAHVARVQARTAARLWDVARHFRRQPQGPLSGVPLGIKDLYMVRLMPARLGSRAFKYLVSPADDANVARQRKAGAIILGKLAASEFGAVSFTEPDIHPPTRNPWDLGRTSGGSSGGTGTAVAAGLTSIGHGSDGGGSIRIPAALCGVFGFKPSRGALHHVSKPDRLRMSTEGPLSRTVEDAQALLSVLAVEPGRLANALAHPPGPGLKVVVHTSTTLAPTDPALVDATLKVARLLADFGHKVDEAPWLEIALEEFLVLWRSTMANIPVLNEAVLQPVTRWLRAAGKEVPHEVAEAKLRDLAARIDAWWGDADLHVSPTVSCAPPAVGSWRKATPEASFACSVPLGCYTAGYNVGGHPAMSIPAGFGPDGLPLAVQIAARRGQDAMLLGLAKQLETAMGGFSRRPRAYA
jgi:amidase